MQYALSCYGQGRPTEEENYQWDRSGNNTILNAVNLHVLPDLIAGSTCMVSMPNLWVGILSPAPARMKTTGACTWTMRFCPKLYGGVAGWSDENTSFIRNLFALEGTLGSTNAVDNVLSTVFFSADTARKLTVYRETGTKVGQSFVCTNLSMPKDGRWHFFSFRRDDAGVCTFGIDASYETINATPPTGGSNCTLRIGTGPTSSSTALNGLIADLCMWDA